LYLDGVDIVETIVAIFDPAVGASEPCTAGEIYDAMYSVTAPGIDLYSRRAVGFALDLLVATRQLTVRNRAWTDHTTEYAWNMEN